MGKSKRYLGWKNYETWNVALFLNQDGLLAYFYLFNEDFKDIRSYRDYIKVIGYAKKSTGDGVHYLKKSLDYKALTELLMSEIDQ